MNDIARKQAKADALKGITAPDHARSPGADESGLVVRDLVKRFKNRYRMHSCQRSSAPSATH